MSDNKPLNTILDTTLHAPYQVRLAQTLSEYEQQTIASLLQLLPDSCIQNIQSSDNDAQDISTLNISSIVDGRGLACPMPLLKTKVALRNVAAGDSLYVVATDPNSQADIVAFCQQTQQTNHGDSLLLIINQATNQTPTADIKTAVFDTIFHFIITKTDSN